MSNTLETLSMTVSIVEFVMGIFSNGFIILINGIDWVRSRKIFLIDLIFVCLASSRISLLSSTFLSISLHIMHEEKLYSSKSVLMSVITFWAGSSYFCAACTTCLNVFYFFKIANFSNSIFLWMKQKMEMVLLTILLGSVLSFCSSMIFVTMYTTSLIQGWVETRQNFTFNFMQTSPESLNYLILIHMALIIFFVVSVASFLLLIFSLWSHTKRMKLQGMYSRDSSMEAHVKAMKVMISSLLLFIMHHVSNVLVLLTYSILDGFVPRIFAHVLIFLYPSGHPFLLILWNKKLKQASLCVLRKLKC